MQDERKCSSSFSLFGQLTDNEKYLFRWRSELNDKIQDTSKICKNHKLLFLDLYESRDYCSNPYNLHTKRVKNSLRTVSLSVALNFKEISTDTFLPPGSKLCTKCRLQVLQEMQVSVT